MSIPQESGRPLSQTHFFPAPPPLPPKQPRRKMANADTLPVIITPLPGRKEARADLVVSETKASNAADRLLHPSDLDEVDPNFTELIARAGGRNQQSKTHHTEALVSSTTEDPIQAAADEFVAALKDETGNVEKKAKKLYIIHVATKAGTVAIPAIQIGLGKAKVVGKALTLNPLNLHPEVLKLLPDTVMKSLPNDVRTFFESIIKEAETSTLEKTQTPEQDFSSRLQKIQEKMSGLKGKLLITAVGENIKKAQEIEEERLIALEFKGKIPPNLAIDLTHLDDHAELSGTSVFVTEAAIGDLDKMLKEAKTLSLPQLARLAHGVSLGMEQLHDHGRVHGDVKSDNVLVFQNEDGSFVAKVADFGKSVVVTSDDQQKVYSGNPRQIDATGTLSKASDVLGEGMVICKIFEAPLFAEGETMLPIDKYKNDPAFLAAHGLSLRDFKADKYPPKEGRIGIEQFRVGLAAFAAVETPEKDPITGTRFSKTKRKIIEGGRRLKALFSSGKSRETQEKLMHFYVDVMLAESKSKYPEAMHPHLEEMCSLLKGTFKSDPKLRPTSGEVAASLQKFSSWVDYEIENAQEGIKSVKATDAQEQGQALYGNVLVNDTTTLEKYISHLEFLGNDEEGRATYLESLQNIFAAAIKGDNQINNEKAKQLLAQINSLKDSKYKLDLAKQVRMAQLL